MAARADLREAELAHLAGFDPAAELLRHGLHPVADPQHRHTGFEHRLRRAIRGFLVGRHVAAGQDDATRAVIADELVGDVRRMDFAVDAGLPHAACNQLRDLGTEI